MPEPDGVPIDDELNQLEEHEDTPIERFRNSAAGEVTGAAMTGFAKALGWWANPERPGEIRESGAKPPDPDDPIEVQIDADHPENTRIVFHVRADDPHSQN
jgi:hypothetical protein